MENSDFIQPAAVATALADGVCLWCQQELTGWVQLAILLDPRLDHHVFGMHDTCQREMAKRASERRASPWE